MALYAVYYSIDLCGNIAEALGSDACLRIDARLSLNSAHRIAADHSLSLRYVQHYVAYRLFRGHCLREIYPASPLVMFDNRG